MPLTIDELTTFTTNGMVIRRDAVPLELVNRAHFLITEWYRSDMDDSRLVDYTRRTFAPELGNHPDILALLDRSGVTDLIGELVGDFCPSRPHNPDSCPENELHKASRTSITSTESPAPHLDPAELRTFSLLVGVVLSDITDAAGVRCATSRRPPSRRNGSARMVARHHRSSAPIYRRERALPSLGVPGDVLLMHHLVPHAVGRNRNGPHRGLWPTSACRMRIMQAAGSTPCVTRGWTFPPHHTRPLTERVSTPHRLGEPRAKRSSMPAPATHAHRATTCASTAASGRRPHLELKEPE